MTQLPRFTSKDIAGLKFNEAGLIPAVIQSAETKRVLMMAWMNAESLALTLDRGETVFWSRSRGEIWHKGATSGNAQVVQSIQLDCDADTLLILVSEAGPACHTGTESCFDTKTIYSNPEQKANL
jgi:phosphoribosyl-AMP cyclohydrolase